MNFVDDLNYLKTYAVLTSTFILENVIMVYMDIVEVIVGNWAVDESLRLPSLPLTLFPEGF